MEVNIGVLPVNKNKRRRPKLDRFLQKKQLYTTLSKKITKGASLRLLAGVNVFNIINLSKIGITKLTL